MTGKTKSMRARLDKSSAQWDCRVGIIVLACQCGAKVPAFPAYRDTAHSCADLVMEALGMWRRSFSPGLR